MTIFELEPTDISNLNDAELRDLVTRLCEAELLRQGVSRHDVYGGGAQEAPDGGLDVRVDVTTALPNPSFVPREKTGFQVKKNSMPKSACKKEMLADANLKAVIKELADVQGAYIIVSGKDNCSDKMRRDRISGMKSALEGVEGGENLLVDFYGSDRLCSWLREHPSVALWVREKLGKSLDGWKPFGQWTNVPRGQDDDFLDDEHRCVTDKNLPQAEAVSIAEGIALVRNKLREHGMVVRLIGLSGVGKTRFAQALFEDEFGDNKSALAPVDVIYADLGDSLNPSASQLVERLIAGAFSCYLILDNCPPDVHRQLQQQITNKSTKLSLLTIEYDISDDSPEQTDVIHIEPSSISLVAKLVQRRFPAVGYDNAMQIAEFAGGNARLAIALANTVNTEETLSKFSDEDLFKRLFEQRKGKDERLLESAELLSLVYSFNIDKQEFNNELEVLGSIGEINRKTLMRHQSELLTRQLIQKRGKWRAVLPHALANRLARRALECLMPDDINAELLKTENFRLFKSCAHRLGYLHGVDAACELVRSWMQQEGPFFDLTNCTRETLTAFEYVAPVIPGIALVAIERAACTPNFCSRANPNFSFFVNLLRKIAYEDQYFERAATIILKFAETERNNENCDSIVNQLSSLFSLKLSGTHATPERRQAFLKRMLDTGEKRQFEIAQEIFMAVFEFENWSWSFCSDFGARYRDYGWFPKNEREVLDWIEGFIELLASLLDSRNVCHVIFAKEILVTNFSKLWSNIIAVPFMEGVVQKYGAKGRWPALWIAIKNTINYHSRNYSPELLRKTEELERLTAPSDLFSEIESYVLVKMANHANVSNDGESRKNLEQKIEKIGSKVVLEPKYLDWFASKFWKEDVDSLYYFGKGIAKSSPDKRIMFNDLVNVMQRQNLPSIGSKLFEGFIVGVYEFDPRLAWDFQQLSLDIPELKPHYVSLLCSTPLTKENVKRLIEIAEMGELKASSFYHLLIKQKEIGNDDFWRFIQALGKLEDSFFFTSQLLNKRLKGGDDASHILDERLLSFGVKVIKRKLGQTKQGLLSKNAFDQIGRIINTCLSPGHVDESEIINIVDSLCSTLEESYKNKNRAQNLIFYLVKYYPEVVLERAFKVRQKTTIFSKLLFYSNGYTGDSLLNVVSVERLINWCNQCQKKIQYISSLVTIYQLDTDSTQNDERKTILSEHILSLIGVAKDKSAVIDILYKCASYGIRDCSQSSFLESRSKAISQLLNHESVEVRQSVKHVLKRLEADIQREKEFEAQTHSRKEQRFEY